MQTQAGEGTLFRQTPSGLERRQQSRVYGRGSQGANGTESIARKPPCLTRGKGKITTRCGKRPRPGKGPGKGLHEALRLLGLRQDAFQSHRARAPQTGAQNGSGSRGAGGGGSRPQGLLFPKRDRRTERGSGPLVAPGLLRSIRASFLHGVHHGRFLALLGHRAWRAALSQAARGAGNPALQGPGGTERDPESLRTVRWDPTLAVDRAPRSSLHFRNGPLEITSDCHHDRRRENSPGLKERPREK